MAIKHDTIQFDRQFGVPAARVFIAWQDTAALQRWSFPGDQTWTGRIVENDFNVGGRKRMSFGVKGQPPFSEETRYLEIVRNKRIVMAENISLRSTRLSASLVSVEVEETEQGSSLRITDQIAIFQAADHPDKRREGWQDVLDKLAREVLQPTF
jgi:uncharacterized protein YndB with AHSA1/START domain